MHLRLPAKARARNRIRHSRHVAQLVERRSRDLTRAWSKGRTRSAAKSECASGAQGCCGGQIQRGGAAAQAGGEPLDLAALGKPASKAGKSAISYLAGLSSLPQDKVADRSTAAEKLIGFRG